MGNIIYERRYPRENAERIEALSKTLDKETEETQQIPTFEEFLRRVYENQVCILIPERQRLAEKFIRERGLDITLCYGAYPDRVYDSPAIWGDNAKIRRILAGDGKIS